MKEADPRKNSLALFVLGCLALVSGVVVSLTVGRADGASILGCSGLIMGAAWIVERRSE
ncbi:hypothetical protein [Streptomyces sp. NPDC005805]|uniref:hypothetical protein n=1 Tax=Streptomyces sp. NPDC005805 TaxID=3157068 RepID=UPI0033E7091C